MEASIQEKLSTIAPQIIVKMGRFDNDDHEDDVVRTAKKSTAVKIVEDLVAGDLAYKEWIIAPRVGVHQENRFGVGLDANDLHELLEEVLCAGFCYSEVNERAWCFEVQPGPAGAMQYEFNANLAKNSNGMIPTIEAHEMKVVSVSCGHSNGGVRAVLQGCTTFVDCLKGENGKISRDKVLALCAEYAEPLAKGFHWTVIRYQVGGHCQSFNTICSPIPPSLIS